jgi:hypothetical protein
VEVVVSEDRAERLERDRDEQDAIRDIERAERERERDEQADIRALEWAETKRRWRAWVDGLRGQRFPW